MNGIVNYLSQNDLGPGTAEANMNRARKHYLSNKCRVSGSYLNIFIVLLPVPEPFKEARLGFF